MTTAYLNNLIADIIKPSLHPLPLVIISIYLNPQYSRITSYHLVHNFRRQNFFRYSSHLYLPANQSYLLDLFYSNLCQVIICVIRELASRVIREMQDFYEDLSSPLSRPWSSVFVLFSGFTFTVRCVRFVVHN